ncbi:MAG: SGNH/GDSL hydrolase family protein [Bdellovibrionales bacterium]|nr:SGNH/GDSL hydrolase family protein [Bdellovibrionales bacterium]
MKRLLNRATLVVLAVNAIGLLFFEGATRILAYYGYIPFRYYPTSDQRVLADIDRHFGIWRYPERGSRHQGACFDVAYVTNSFGMRDRERQLLLADVPRHVILGDSFVEGYGVEASQRFTDILEDRTGEEYLNFGVSGDFSSTQQYLVYRELASDFSHDSVAVFLLPDNDFTDNNPAHFEAERYRPYLRKEKEGGDYQIYYSVPFAERGKKPELSWGRRFRRTLYNNVYLLNAFRQLGDLFEESELKDRLGDEVLARQESSYERYSEEDLSKLLWGYQKIAQLAAPRPFNIFVIPREVDFETLDTESAYKAVNLIDDLKSSLAEKFSNVQVYDLLPLFKERLEREKREYDDIFLRCDGHWSPYGHRVVADMIQSVIRKNGRAAS